MRVGRAEFEEHTAAVGRGPSTAGGRSGKGAEILAAAALLCVYLASASSHFQSIDGLVTYREARAIVFDHSLHMSPPVVWGKTIEVNKGPVGLALLYVPGLIVGSRLGLREPPPSDTSYDWDQFYDDPAYTFLVAPLHALFTAAAAYLVARFCLALGTTRRTALWGLALFGIGSPALVYSRGDWNQQFAGLCWVGALYAAWLYRQTGRGAWVWAGAAFAGYAALARPVEGALLLPAVVLLVATRRTWKPAILAVATAYALAAMGTMLANTLKNGSPLQTGYEAEGWTQPPLTGLAGVLVSPGRGILWAFPTVVLVPLGIRWLWRRGHRAVAAALFGLVLAQACNAALWHTWWGGWNWGGRLLVPALPLLAVLGACGLERVQSLRKRRLVAAVLLGAGLAWAVPCLVTNLLGGYAGEYGGTHASFLLRAYPPIGAWRFLAHCGALIPKDPAAVDILWLRAAPATNYLSLIPMGALCLAAVMLARRAVRLIQFSPNFPQAPQNR